MLSVSEQNVIGNALQLHVVLEESAKLLGHEVPRDVFDTLTRNEGCDALAKFLDTVKEVVRQKKSINRRAVFLTVDEMQSFSDNNVVPATEDSGAKFWSQSDKINKDKQKYTLVLENWRSSDGAIAVLRYMNSSSHDGWSWYSTFWSQDQIRMRDHLYVRFKI